MKTFFVGIFSGLIFLGLVFGLVRLSKSYQGSGIDAHQLAIVNGFPIQLRSVPIEEFDSWQTVEKNPCPFLKMKLGRDLMNVQKGPFLWRCKQNLKLYKEQPFQFYFGLLHAHTNDSDGKGIPAEAIASVKSQSDIDFFALTDHSEYWVLSSENRYNLVKKRAELSSDASFLVLPAYEYSHHVFGHYVVINAPSVHYAFQDRELSDFYRYLENNTSPDTVVIFAHPGFHKYRAVFEFEHFNLFPQILEKIVGMEVFYWGSYQKQLLGFGNKLSFFDEAMKKGWILAPLAAQDNHYKEWGFLNSGRTVIFSESLSKEDLIQSLKNRQVYATTVPDLSMVFQFLGDKKTYDMGQRVPANEYTQDTKLLRFRGRFMSSDPAISQAFVEVVVNGVTVAQNILNYDPESGSKAQSDDEKARFDQYFSQKQSGFIYKDFPKKLFVHEIDFSIPRISLSQKSPDKFYIYLRIRFENKLEKFVQTSPIIFGY